MAVLQVQLETERAGTVTVRAKAAPGRESDAKAIAGFYVRRRYAGDTFKINSWREFSPRWMEFVDEPPAEWLTQIKAREGEIEVMAQKAEEENALSPRDQIMRQMLSMAQVAAGGGETHSINQATGKVTRKQASA
jgi:hypothetical protein